MEQGQHVLGWIELIGEQGTLLKNLKYDLYKHIFCSHFTEGVEKKYFKLRLCKSESIFHFY